MKLFLRELFNAKEAFSRLLEEPLSTDVAMELRELTNTINTHFTVLEEKRNDLIKSIGTEKEDGEFEFSKENQDEFVGKFDKMLDVELDLNWDLLSIKALGDAKISVKDLNTLSFLFKEFSNVDVVEEVPVVV
jgi:hypothetical protein